MSRLRTGRAERLRSRSAAPPRLEPVPRRLNHIEVGAVKAIERIHDAFRAKSEVLGIEFRDPLALYHWRKAKAGNPTTQMSQILFSL
ncbi:hypothetical protein [uncultured Ruegeria sp.]|uniref:hypothetical protein n=1 Tax=uncultured Ruegeria sp. TaxID=259304 RepID=UPI00263636F6|nr:hypothetical protein [uncultured Ruegeria sp.]